MEAARRRMMAEEAARWQTIAEETAATPSHKYQTIDLTKGETRDDPPGPSHRTTLASSASTPSSSLFSGVTPGGKKYKVDSRPKTQMINVPPRMPGVSDTAIPPQVRAALANIYDAQSSRSEVEATSDVPLFTSGNELDEEAASIPRIEIKDGETPLEALESLLAQNVEVDYDVQDAKIKGMTVLLKPFQIQGVKWMQQRESGKVKGGILADDMGLGKTIQTIALIVSNHPRNELATIKYIVKEADLEDDTKKPPLKKTTAKAAKAAAAAAADKVVQHEAEKREVELMSHTTLIVAPVAVMKQWQREIQTRSDVGLKVFIHHGASKATSTDQLKNYDVVITSYNTAAMELESPDNVLLSMNWLRVVLDEAHTIKNHKTKAAKACFALGDQAHSKWCLTGTPLQNSARDFFPLIRFVDLPPFNDLRHFNSKIDRPLASWNQHIVDWGMKRLLVVLNAILLRRQKDALFEGEPLITLPQRTVHTVTEPFDNEEETKFYTSWERQARMNAEQQKSTIEKLVVLLRLRQTADSPALVNRKVELEEVAPPKAVERADQGDSTQSDAEVDEVDELADLLSGTTLTTVSCQRCHGQIKVEKDIVPPTMCPQCTEDVKINRIDWNAKGSTKLRMMLKILNQIRESGDEKTIVFSQFTSFIDLIELALKDQGFSFIRYDGSMNAVERSRTLEQFANSPNINVAVMSLKAAAVGINVTCASRVIFTDVWWNPSIQEQAIDRAHRMGQTRDVVAYILAISGTVEERIIALQEKKRALASAALEGTKLKKGSTKLSKAELHYLFNGGLI